MTKITITKTKKIILSAMFLSILLIFSRFISIKTTFLVVSFSFIPIMLAAVYLGPKYGAIIAGLGDLIGAILFPFGSYFPGFTISAALMGFIYGVFLYKKPGKTKSDIKFIIQLTISSILVLGGIKILVESSFLNLLYGKAYLAVIASRFITQLIMLPIQIITIYLLEKALRPSINKYLYSEEKITIDEYLETFDKFTKDPNLEAMKYLMNEFNNPQDTFKVIHVAGTNGKGSICEMISNVLVRQGYNVGKFISPHLIRFNDGIYFNNEEITDNEVEEILIPLSKKITEYNKIHKTPVKWFEAITSLALIYFSRKKCDLVVLETGLGGLTDCTNIANSMISIIGNIGYDHIDILGNTLEKIATQKAGIIKSDSDTIFIEQENITNIIENTCKEKNTKLHLIKKQEITDYKYNDKTQLFNYKNYKEIEINLKGKVQTYNAAEVLECIDVLKQKGYKISEKAIIEGLKTVIHRARMETLNTNPEIVFDGGHNENAINNLRDNIEKYYKNKKRIYIVSILKTKDYKKVIEILCKDKNAIFYFTSGNNKRRYISKDRLYNEAKKYLDDINIHKEEIKDAIDISKKTYGDRVILIVGSFYVYKTVCEVLKND